MKLSRNRIEGFLRAPGADIGAALIYGPDRGLVREYVDRLMAAVAEDPTDPFRVTILGSAELKGGPGRLVDEAATLTLTGDRRVVIVRAEGGDVTDAATAFLVAAEADPGGGALVIVEAGELQSRSALRKAFEQAKHAVAIACYADGAEDLARLTDEIMKAHGVRLTGDARRFAVEHLGGDRLASRSELEKLALYVGEGGEAGVDEVAEVIGDGVALDLDDVVFAAASGEVAALDTALSRAYAAGIEPVSILRTAQRHFQRLQLAGDAMAKGSSADAAMKGLRPVVMFFHQDRFRAQLEHWPLTKITTALELLVEAELDCKSTAIPSEPACGRALMRIAQAAGRR